MVAAEAANRREPGFTGFLPPPSHPLRRLVLGDGPAPLADAGFVDPGSGGRPEPLLGELDETVPAPPAREPFDLLPADRPWGSSAGSLLLHLLIVVLIVVDWHWMLPAPEAPTIPVQLVVEPPPAPKPAPLPQPAHPIHGPLASDDMGNTAKVGPQEVKAPPAMTQATAPPVRSMPAPALIAPPPDTGPTAPPLDLPQVAQALAPPPLPLPKPKPPPQPPGKVAARPAAMSLHEAKVPGPSATRDEYVNYCFQLIQRHAGLLRAIVGGRHGEAIIVFDVHDDGTIGAIEVGQSSGYPDIDYRVEQMVSAVGRFPPLPQWFQGEGFHFTLTQIFPPRGG